MNTEAFIFTENKVILTKPYQLSEEDWTVLTRQFNRLGYGLKNADTAESIFEKLTIQAKKAGFLGYILQPDQAEVILQLTSKKEKTNAITHEKVKELALRAEKHYGTTKNYRLAGYLTTNGRYLDFSEGQDMRTLDHRQISEVLEEDVSGMEAMICFMNYGNIRITSTGLDIIKQPNEAQRQALRDYIYEYDGEIIIDFTNENGNEVGSTEYSRRTASERILNDISSYFVDYHVPEGTVPEYIL